MLYLLLYVEIETEHWPVIQSSPYITVNLSVTPLTCICPIPHLVGGPGKVLMC